MLSRSVFIVAAMLLSATVSADIYQCDLDGTRVFSDRPCGDDARRYETTAAISYIPPDETLPVLAESARRFIAQRRARQSRPPSPRSRAPVASLEQAGPLYLAPWARWRNHGRPHPAPVAPDMAPPPQRYSPLNGPILGTRGTEPYRARLTDPANRGIRR